MAQLEKAIKATAVKLVEESTGKHIDETGKTCGIFQNEEIVGFVLKQGIFRLVSPFTSSISHCLGDSWEPYQPATLLS